MSFLGDIYIGFVTTLRGMLVTGAELFRKPITVQYPFNRREIPERFRGMVVNDVSTCNACTKCARVCPVDCIELKGIGKGKDRRCEYWIIDYSKCCWCALCVESCPDGSLAMSHDYETVYTDRSKMIRDFVAEPVPAFNELDPRTDNYKISDFLKEEKPAPQEEDGGRDAA